MPRPPNLFRYATSELSQDAVLCWLLEWADRSHANTDPPLHRVARGFLAGLFDVANVELPQSADAVRPDRQVQGADIVADVGSEHVLVVEDKTHTANHSDQLQRYRAALAERHPGRELVCVYLKTGDQDGYADVRRKGWAVMTRARLLGILRAGDDVQNAVFRDFVDHLEALDASVAAYASTVPSRWSQDAWKGFFLELQDCLQTGGWNYVPNKAGGFMGFWWSWLKVEGGEIYLQLEQDKLTVKVRPDDQQRRRELRDRWVHRFVSHASGLFKRPPKLGNGKYMTVALVSGDYRVLNDGGVLDLDSTIAALRRVESEARIVVAAHEGS